MPNTGAGPRVRSSSIRVLLLASTALAFAGTAFAQEGAAPGEPPEEGRDVVVVVGSQIVGAQPTEALPVNVLGRDEIDAIGAISGDELYRSIPQLGDVSFNATRTIGSLNDARGDTASVNLRSVGAGNTLVLLNGRRLVNHPTAQSDNGVPVMSVNANTIPVAGISRVEVLLDGASALYGADAVAGVMNNVLKRDFEGITAELQYGMEDGVSADELTASIEAGFDLNDGAGHLSLFGSYYGRDPIFASERDFTANADQSRRVPAQWASIAGSFDNRSATSAWGIFDRVTAGTITVNGQPVTDSNGRFHIQPAALLDLQGNNQCRADLGNGICIDDTSTRDVALRYNINEDLTVQNGVDRYNLFLQFDHDLGDNLELFGEAGVYLADTVGYREAAPMLGAVPIIVPATNYYNPFGPFGSPNRLANSNAPAGGLALQLGVISPATAYRPIDAGPRRTEVENLTTRLLAGLRGDFDGWDWETALVYSQANATDKENRISNTLFMEALSRSTPDAYNPFNGGCLDNYSSGDCTPSDAATIEDISVWATRLSKTSLTMWDAKISRPDLFAIWAGDVGIAAGVELRRETYSDDRDPRQDGTVTYSGPIIGTAPNNVLNTNDLMGNNPSLDVSGARNVESAYVELAVPLLRDLPLAQEVNLQLAARYEHSDTFGEVTKPKVALSWRPTDFLLVRSAWSEGFKTPNLQQQFETEVQRSNQITDYLFCHATYGASWGSCPEGTSTPPVIRSGSETLKPEQSENVTAGIVFEATFLPAEWGELSLTADWWRIRQEDVINVFGETNHLALDYALRLLNPTNPNAGNPNVVRDDASALTPAELTAFQNQGIAPVGHVSRILDGYYNQDRATTEGLDLGLYYNLDGTAFGDFAFRVNAANLYNSFGDISEPGALINAAAEAGVINSNITVGGAQGQQVRREGRPKWRYTSTLTWRNGAFGAGWFTSYTGSVLQTVSATAFVIDDYQTHNAYLQYELGQDTDSPTRFRLGVRNLFDETPPLADTNFGFLGELHSPQGRFVYVNVRKTF